MKIQMDIPFQLQPGVLVHRLVGKEETLPFGLSLMMVEPGASATPAEGEQHPNTETLYMIEGVLTAVFQDKTITVGPNEVLHLPSRIPHHVKNTHPTVARAIVVASPDWGTEG